MKIGLIGYQGAGKSALFEWLSGVPVDPALSHVGQSAMAPVPDARIEPLCDIYHPKKITQASLELVDTPGLARDQEGNATRLQIIREAGCLVLVVPAFDNSVDWRKDLARFEEDLLFADMSILVNRIERLRESVKKPKPTRDQELAELAALEPLLVAVEAGAPLAGSKMTDEQFKATRSFRLLTEKPRFILVNLGDDADPEKFLAEAKFEVPAAAVRLGLEVELARLSPEDRAEMLRDLGIVSASRDDLVRTLMHVSGQMLYFTAGDKEVRTWMLRQGGTALEAAANIHTDLARGFIRAETMQCEDLVRLGSEREVKANHLVRQEPKDYVVRDGDILHIRFSV